MSDTTDDLEGYDPEDWEDPPSAVGDQAKANAERAIIDAAKAWRDSLSANQGQKAFDVTDLAKAVDDLRDLERNESTR